MVNPTLSWERVGRRFYRTFEGYSMQWAVHVAESHLVVAPYGGAIAVWDRTDVIRPGVARKAQIAIYSGSGRLLATIPWDLGQITGAAWSEDDELMILASSGVARKYTDFAGNFVQIRLVGPITHVQWLPDGFIAQTEDKWTLVTDFSSASFPQIDLPSQILDWVAVPADSSSGRDHAIIATAESAVLYTFDKKKHPLSIEPLLSLRLSPDNMWLMGQKDGQIYIYGTDTFQEEYRFEAFRNAASWVGVAAVAALEEEDSLSVLDLNSQEKLTLEFDSAVLVFSEVDGLRIFSDHSHDFFAPVPDVVTEIFRLGSRTPSAILLNCVDLLEKKSPQANENLSVIGIAALPGAVDTCCVAAAAELDPRWQKKLLRAASFGKSVLDLYDSTLYLDVMEKLRIANTLRSDKIGMLVTVNQMDILGPAKVLRRLQALKCYGEAIAVAQVLKYPVEPVYIAWACHQIQSNVDFEDADLERLLAATLDNILGISYVEMAQSAFDEGRPKLARTLINREPQAQRRVKLLLRLHEYERALQVSVDSGNVALLFYTILSLASNSEVSLPQFYRLLGDKRPAIEAYKRLCTLRPNAKETVHKFLYQMDLVVDDINLTFAEACAEPEIDPKLVQLVTVQKRFAELKSTHFEGQATAEFAALLTLQKQLESEFEMPFANLSASDTVVALLNISQTNRAQKVANKFHISDKQFWWLRLRSLVSRREWTDLLEFAKSRKSPIGYLPFYEQTLQAGNLEAAGAYVDMCTNVDYKERVQMYLKTNQRDKAIELARKLRNESLVPGL